MKNTAIILISLFILARCYDNPKNINISKVCFKNECFNVELANTTAEREMGLMCRENLDPQAGMFFIFPATGRHSFWMKNTLIPLDIIWINEENKIVFISKDTKPCAVANCPLIFPNKDALYTLEINTGIADRMNLQVGDDVVMQ